MLDAKLIAILRKLNTRERTRFREYVSAPFFNKHEALIRLCEYILDFAPDFNDERLDKKTAFFTLFPNEKFSEQRIYTLLSNLLELMNGYLAQIEFEDNQLEQKRYTMTALRKRKASKQWHSVKKQYEILDSKRRKKDAAALSESILFHIELDAQFISKQLREQDENLQLSSDLLDHYYFAEKLRFACDMTSRNIVIKADYKSLEIDTILEIIDRNWSSLKSVPPIAVYRSILKMLEDESDEYFKTVAIIKENLGNFSLEETKTQFDYAINYVIRKLNSGQPQWHKEFLDLHRFLLEKEILMTDGKLPEWDYKNIVTVALRADEKDWVEQFIMEYKNRLPENIRENAYSYNLAAFHFASANYREALQLLMTVVFTDESYQLGSKIIQLKSYYELEEWEAALSLIQSFRLLTERSKTLSDYRKQSNLNMLKVAKKLFKLQLDWDYENSQSLKKQLNALEKSIEKYQPMANTDWLLEKTAKLKSELS